MHYYILALSKHRSRLFDVRGERVTPVSVAGMPESKDEKWEGMERQDPSLQSHTAGGSPVFHGESASDIEKGETESYVRSVAKSLHPLLAGNHTPLVFVGVEQEFGMFRSADTSGALLDDFVHGSPDHMMIEDVKEKADPIARAYMLKEATSHLEEYGNLLGTGRTSDSADAILEAAQNGKVDQLFIEDGHGGELEHIVEHVRQHRGRIWTVEKGSIPAGASVAAILRH